MAVLKLTSIVSSINGKLNGSLFGNTGNTKYIRNKVTPVNKVSPAQGRQRIFIGSLTQSWRYLTESQRIQWTSFALNHSTTNRVGDVVYLTGFNWYVRLNSNLNLIKESLISVPPSVPSQIFISGMFFSIQENPDSMATLVLPNTPIGYRYVIYGTTGIPAGQKPKDNQYRFLALLDLAPAIITVITPAYHRAFGGIPPTGSIIWFKAKAIHIASGFNSPFIINTGNVL